MKNIQAIETTNANYLISDGSDYFFAEKTGKFLRFSDPSEWEYLEYRNKVIDIDDFQIIGMPQIILVKEKDFTLSIERIDEDYNNYDPARCNNGGQYGFWTDKVTISFRGKNYYFESERTTAEFEYDELTGSFHTGLSSFDVGIQIEKDIYIFEGLYIVTKSENIKGDIFII